MSDYHPLPLILSRHKPLIAEAEAAKAAVLTIAPEACVIRQAGSGDRTGPGEPAGGFGLRHIGKARYAGWFELAGWLAETARTMADAAGRNRRVVLLVDIDHPWREFVLYLSRIHGMAFGILHADTIPPIRAMEYALLTNATVQVFTDEGLADAYHKASILPYRKAFSLGEVERMALPATDNAEAGAPRPKAKRPAKTGSKAPVPGLEKPGADRPIRLLMMAYFTGDCRSVGVARPNYWFDKIGELSDGRIEVDLVTATEWHDRPAGVHWVRDHNIASVLDADGAMPDWGRATITSEQKDAKSFSTLSHYWRFAVERHFDSVDADYDVVLISGNPFSCFDFAAYAKQRWHARVILDYRDPFANNPRILYADDQRAWARYTEKGYNLQSDLLVTVNQTCLDYFECKDEVPNCVVENGFDERVLPEVKRQSFDQHYINFVHAGSFYHDRSPDALISALDPKIHRLHHVGGHGGISEKLLDRPQLVLHGRNPYPDTLGLLAGGDIGVVFLSKTAFETTTKIYDYLAMDLDVLICTHGGIGQGALAEMLDGVDHIHWCQNTPKSIAAFVKSYQPKRQGKSSTAERFSRAHHTHELIRRIEALVA